VRPWPYMAVPSLCYIHHKKKMLFVNLIIISNDIFNISFNQKEYI